MSDRATLDVYERMAKDYADRVRADERTGMQTFLSDIKPGARVLDLGCGPGNDAAAMAKAGYDVLAVDAAAAMVTLAASQEGVTAQQAQFDDIPTLGQFAGIWASFSLLHAPRADLPRHLSDIHAACDPRAPFCIGMKTGTGEGPDQLGRHYTYYSDSALRGALDAAGFTVSEAWYGQSKGLAGNLDPWIILLSHA